MANKILKYIGKTKVYMHIPNVVLKNLDKYINKDIVNIFSSRLDYWYNVFEEKTKPEVFPWIV